MIIIKIIIIIIIKIIIIIIIIRSDIDKNNNDNNHHQDTQKRNVSEQSRFDAALPCLIELAAFAFAFAGPARALLSDPQARDCPHLGTVLKNT